MKYPELVKRLQDHNRRWTLEYPECESSWRPEVASVKSHGVIADAEFDDRMCGFTHTAEEVTDLKNTWLLLNDANQQEWLVAVGSCADTATRESTEDWPVVLAIGMNPGEDKGSADRPVPLEHDTRLRPQAGAVLQALQKRRQCLEEVGDFHLATATFFPWVTRWSWEHLNAMEESLLLRCAGLSDPVSPIVGLIDRLNPQIVIFHGAYNALPGLGWQVVDSVCGASSGRSACAFLFADTLVPPYRHISTAVMTRYSIGRHNLPPDFDA